MIGSIEPYQLSSGATRYVVRWRDPDTGAQKKKRGFVRKLDASNYLAEITVASNRGEYVDPSAGKITVGALGPVWLASKKARAASTYNVYESTWRNHVEPRWGSTRLSNIRHTAVQSWLTELYQQFQDGGKDGAKTVRNAHGVLSGILNGAVKDRRIANNPAAGVDLPALVKKPNTYLTAEQLGALADEAGRYRSLVLLLGTVGLRIGEALGLTPGDIDFLAAGRRDSAGRPMPVTALIHRNATRAGSRTLKGSEHRTVVLPQKVVDELAATCRGTALDAPIWPSEKGGWLKPPSTHDSWWSGAVSRCQKAATAARAAELKAAEAARAAELAAHPDRTPATVLPTTPVFPDLTPHDLRHTAASLAISVGANVKAVQRMLGHKSAAMTLDTYADLFDDDLAAVAQKIDSVVPKLCPRGQISVVT